jgi:hypothetical protein
VVVDDDVAGVLVAGEVDLADAGVDGIDPVAVDPAAGDAAASSRRAVR